jgi:hypothetical protein
MVNNTSRQRWSRADARQLDARFMQAVMQGMNCSRFEAEAIRDAVHEVYAPLLEASDSLQPGQLRLSVTDAGVAPNVPLAQAAQRLVTLTLEAGAADRAVRRRGGVLALRRHRLLRLCEEAFQQGGLLTLEGVADLCNCAVRTLVSDLAALRRQGLTPPLRSTVKDMGRALTHRTQIVTRWLAGEEYTEIAAATCHSLGSVASYVEKYKRCAALFGAGFDPERISLIARLSPPMVRALQHLQAHSQPVAHRREELEALSHKRGTSHPRREAHP